MTDKEKILVISAIDELLVHSLNHSEHFTDEERDKVEEKADEIFDMTSPKDIRETLISLSRKLYDELSLE